MMTASHMMFGGAQQSTYGTAKIAVMGIAKALAIERKQHGILINTVSPMAYTPCSGAYIDEQTRPIIQAQMPAADVAITVAWLAHKNSQVTGETVGLTNRLIARVFLAETKGYFGPEDEAWTLESARDNWHKVLDESEYTVSTDMAEYGPKIFQRLLTRQ
ncbi:bifunctional hydroxyacyl-CoA dehydrogenase/enoyl-CoA hydratase fox2 [Fusarium torreyae]|uniref:Bifunctional hydroxyacyl-CoA dehydrogenase/enoyl-CoA hydratase fox2 n=1 Tax=Fusarium torreyae TaxID=1237075 RepID=A0A9W8VEZ4_9HYPO|nr:bifunctional hydroxyacyl-CoA dehydrogenase/enoyl-CoA hydratase fox2 [Fusarium torreyae]